MVAQQRMVELSLNRKAKEWLAERLACKLISWFLIFGCQPCAQSAPSNPDDQGKKNMNDVHALTDKDRDKLP